MLRLLGRYRQQLYGRTSYAKTITLCGLRPSFRTLFGLVAEAIRSLLLLFLLGEAHGFGKRTAPFALRLLLGSRVLQTELERDRVRLGGCIVRAPPVTD